MEPAVPKEFSETCDENYIPDDGIFMKEELIITDVANQLDNEQTENVVTTTVLENVNTDDIQLVIIPSNVETKLEEGTNEPKAVDDDDIIIISEEKPTKINRPNQPTQKQLPKQNVIVPEIAQQMLRIKTEMQKNKKVPQSIVFVKKCRLCQKVQKESRSHSMIKCQDCESRCFLFQCLLCFKRYTTFPEVYTHIDKKHEDKIFKEPVKKRVENKQQFLSSKGIKVKSNKCLKTDEKFQFNSNGYTPTINQPSTVTENNIVQQLKKSKIEDKEENECEDYYEEEQDYEDLASKLNNFEILLKEDIPLKQTELDNPNNVEVFYCDQCSYSSPVKRYYQDHVRRRHTPIDPKNYKTCPLCSKIFRISKDLNAHKIHCGKEPQHKCKFCGYKTKLAGTLKVHMQTHVVKAKVGELEPLADVDNSSSQPNGSDIKQEDSQSKNEASTSKATCITSIQEMVENQIKNTIQAFCNSCNKRFKATEPTLHCAKCNDFLVYRCKTCNNSSVNYADVYEHVVRVHFAHREKPCPRCNKMVIDMKSHLRFCGMVPNFSCKHCSFKTKHHYSFITHSRINHQTDRKDFIKCDKCNKEFAALRYLQRHQKYYCDTEKCYGCAHCSLKTRSKGNLIRHLRLLHMETISDVKFTCKKCNVEYRSVFMYDKHIKHCTQ